MKDNNEILMLHSIFQVLHVIDDILTPLTAVPSSSVEVNNMDGFQFLTWSDSLEIGGFRIR